MSKPKFKWTNNSTEAGDTSGTLVLFSPGNTSFYDRERIVLKFNSYAEAHNLIEYMELVVKNAVSNFKHEYAEKVQKDLLGY